MDTQTLSEAAPVRAAHDPEVPSNLIDFMRGDWLDNAAKHSAMPAMERFNARREALSRAFPSETLVIPAGEERVRANDTNFRFRPSSDFAYVIGPAAEAGSVAIMEPDGRGHRTVLFVPPHNRGEAAFFTDRVAGELWIGAHRGVEESREFFGVDEARASSDIAAYLETLRSSGAAVRTIRELDARIDRALTQSDGDAEFATRIAEMRLLKDTYEIEELRRCVEITKRGFEDVIALMKDGVSEREVEAAFWRRARIDANDVGYLTIAASGANACTLHWTKNHGSLRSGDVLLLDAGVEADSLYTADVTRTLPVSGRFSPEQRCVYDIVFEAQKAAFAAARPGSDFLDLTRAAMRVLSEGLIQLGVLRCSLDEALDEDRQYFRRYTLHGVSHMLGIDVHDCARARSEQYRYGTLKAGMALTVEPGLYFQPNDATVPERLRGIGVRIEDDVVITAEGHENLSAILPSHCDAVEQWIARVRGA